MREILFRGKRLDTGEWIVGHLLRYEDGRARINQSHTDIFCYEKDNSIIQTVAFPVDPETVGQYTECKDRMGERIFEGDILAFNPGDGEETSHYLVRWDNARWTVCTGRGYADDEMIDWESEYWTVIGNIYDNPELLGGAE